MNELRAGFLDTVADTFVDELSAGLLDTVAQNLFNISNIFNMTSDAQGGTPPGHVWFLLTERMSGGHVELETVSCEKRATLQDQKQRGEERGGG